MSRLSFMILCLIVLYATPGYCFGAGSIPSRSTIKGVNFRHGDIMNSLLAMSASGNLLTKLSPMDFKRIYFGNWLRDYSQFMEVKPLSMAPQMLLCSIVSILGYLEFGYATGEFDVTIPRLGVYRPEQHIDNPRGYQPRVPKEYRKNEDGRLVPWYDDNSPKQHNDLRDPPSQEELEIDPVTGMKNYIANEKYPSTTLSYVKDILRQSVQCARGGDRHEGMRHLGSALHVFEDFFAHSNYVELSLTLVARLDGFPEIYAHPDYEAFFKDVFAYVGDGAKVQTQRGLAPPLVTGTFGPLDFVQSLLGEIDDKAAASNLKELDLRLGQTGIGSSIDNLITILGDIPGFGGLAKQAREVKEGPASGPPISFEQFKSAPNSLWQAIEPAFRLRDNIARFLQDNVSIHLPSFISTPIQAISDAVDQFVFAIIGVFVKPIMGKIREMLQEQKRLLLDEEEMNKDASESIFAPGSQSTDPTHSQLAKDHFDNPLNTIAGHCAAKVSSRVLEVIEQCWNNPNIDANAVIDWICTILHHPYNADAKNLFHREILRLVYVWAVRGHDSGEITSADVKRWSKESVAARQYHGHTHSQVRTEKLEIKMDAIITKIKDGEDGNEQDTEADKATSADEAPAVRALDTIEVADASAQNPNPLDAALEDLSGEDLLKVFQDSTIQDVLAQPGMGNLLRDCGVQMMIESGKFKTDDALSLETPNATAETSKEILDFLQSISVKPA